MPPDEPTEQRYKRRLFPTAQAERIKHRGIQIAEMCRFEHDTIIDGAEYIAIRLAFDTRWLLVPDDGTKFETTHEDHGPFDTLEQAMITLKMLAS